MSRLTRDWDGRRSSCLARANVFRYYFADHEEALTTIITRLIHALLKVLTIHKISKNNVSVQFKEKSERI